MMKFEFKPIGFIRSQHRELTDAPIQSAYGKNFTGKAEILLEFIPGLKDLEGFSHIMLIYVFDRFHKSEYKLHVKPFLDDEKRGVFATRAPRRPNHIGVSIVKIEQIKNNMIFFSGADMLDNTPLIDIKPYVPEFDADEKYKTGWLKGKTGGSKNKFADDRFK